MRIRRAVVKEQVKRLLVQFNVTRPPVDIEAIARGLKAEVIYHMPEEEDQVSGFIYRDSTRTLIGINQDEPEGRRRFTLAHECGHLVLHDDRNYFFDNKPFYRNRNEVSSTGQDREEIEANFFAAEILMPESLLIQEMKEHQCLGESEIGILAKRFKVSEQAMAIRMAQLGLLE